jgi:dTDP-4-dehydrorhamnose 3,5-epimerase
MAVAMPVAQLAIEGLLLITPDVYRDARGFFFECWNQLRWHEQLQAHGQQAQPFLQDNHSLSTQGVLRGLHWQVSPRAQGKLVRCVVGEVFDVAVDLRQRSPSFGQWCGVRLSASNHHQLWVPVGFAHGFLTLSDTAEVLYKATDVWCRSCERSLHWQDPQLAITWPLDRAPQLSDKDAAAPWLAQLHPEDLFV